MGKNYKEGWFMYKKYKKELFKSSIKLVVLTTSLSLIITILEFISPLLVKRLIDNYSIEKNIKLSIYIIAGSYIVAISFKLLANYVTMKYYAIFKTREMKKLFHLMMCMDYTRLNKLEPTYVVDRIHGGIETLFNLFSSSISTYIIASINIVLCLGVSFVVNKFITIVLLIIIPIQIIGNKKLNRKLGVMCEKLQETCAKNFSDILSITREVDYIKQCKNSDSIISLLTPNIETINKANAEVGRFAKKVSILLSDAITMIKSGMYIYITILMLEGKITLSDFVFMELIINIFFPALNSIVNADISMRDLKGVYTFIENDIINNLEQDGTKVLSQVKNVSFNLDHVGYENNVIIESGSFEAKQGDIIMIQGKSGCGKSSLMKGLVKFLPIKGISINGIPISEYTNESLREKIVFFSQNVPIIAGTLEDNILLGDESRRKRLSLLDQLDYFKKFKDRGLDSRIQENGSNLSGGDKQKIALTRAFLDQSEIIILDEITNSIDSTTAVEIIQEILKLYKNKIIFMISHDNYVEQFCNKKVLIEDKKVKEVAM